MSSCQPTRLAASFKTGSLVLEYKDTRKKQEKLRHRRIHLNEYIDSNRHLTDHELVVAIKRDIIYEGRHKKYFEQVRSSQLEEVLLKLIHSIRPPAEEEAKEEEIEEDFDNDFMPDENDQYNFETDADGFENNEHDFNDNVDNFDEFDNEFEKNFGDDNIIEGDETGDVEEGEATDVDGHAVYESYANTDLNKLENEELDEVKARMDVLYQKNQKRPGDSGYEYDKQIDFKPTESSDWDD
jgi:hypothetical protein